MLYVNGLSASWWLASLDVKQERIYEVSDVVALVKAILGNTIDFFVVVYTQIQVLAAISIKKTVAAGSIWVLSA